MRMKSFSWRVMREILRDPLSMAFGLGFPGILLLLLSMIQKNVPVPLFTIAHLTPGIAVFGLTFLSLFVASLIAKDRESALFERLVTTEMTMFDFLLGYTLPMLPFSMAQIIFIYLLAWPLGLSPSFLSVSAMLSALPLALFFIGLGILFGSLFSVKQVGGICGAALTNLAAWLSGTWFDLSLVGGIFEGIARVLPFYHAVEIGRAVLDASVSPAPSSVIIVIVYSLAAPIAGASVFVAKLKK